MLVKVFIFTVATTPHLKKSKVLNDLILSFSLGSLAPGEASCYVMKQPHGEDHVGRNRACQ